MSGIFTGIVWNPDNEIISVSILNENGTSFEGILSDEFYDDDQISELKRMLFCKIQYFVEFNDRLLDLEIKGMECFLTSRAVWICPGDGCAG